LPASAAPLGAGLPASTAAADVAVVAEGAAVVVAVAVAVGIEVVAAVVGSGGIGGAGGGVLSAPPQAMTTKGTAKRSARALRMARILLRNAVEGNDP
jgi:hypothetical protein